MPYSLDGTVHDWMLAPPVATVQRSVCHPPGQRTVHRMRGSRVLFGDVLGPTTSPPGVRTSRHAENVDSKNGACSRAGSCALTAYDDASTEHIPVFTCPGPPSLGRSFAQGLSQTAAIGASSGLDVAHSRTSPAPNQVSELQRRLPLWEQGRITVSEMAEEAQHKAQRQRQRSTEQRSTTAVQHVARSNSSGRC